MTSKNLFFKLQKEDLKRRIWLIVISFLCLVLVRPVYALFRLQMLEKIEEGYIFAEINIFVRKFFAPDNGMLGFEIFVLAIFIGFSSFSYLFSRKKTDFYHTIPLKREKLFMVHYGSGILTYAAVYVVTQLLCILVVAGKGYFSADLLPAIGQSFLFDGLFFLAIYHTVILVSMLTGNLIVAVMGTGVFFTLIPITMEILRAYCGYFKTFYNDIQYGPALWLSGISPIFSYAQYFAMSESSIPEFVSKAGYMLLLLVSWTIGALALALFLYKRRPSEAAEKAMVFKRSETIIRVILVIAAALFGGIFFDSMSSHIGEWFWFGFVLAGIVMHAALEAIYRFDFRAVFRHKIQLILCLVAAAFIVLIFQQDLFHYDERIPNKEKVEYASVEFSNLDETAGYSLNIIDGGTVVDENYMGTGNYALLNMQLQDLDSVLKLAEAGIAQSMESQKENEDYWNSLRYTIRYHLKNGRDMYRTYKAPVATVRQELKAIYESEAYKKDADILRAMVQEKSSSVERLVVYDTEKEENVILTNNKMWELLQLYQEEWEQLSLEEMETEVPVARLALEVKTERYYSAELHYYVYPSFQKTIAFLEKEGIIGFDAKAVLTPDRIVRVKAMKGIIPEERYAWGASSFYTGEFKEKEYEKSDIEKTDLAEFCKNVMPAKFADAARLLHPYEEGVSFQVEYRTPEGTEKSTNVYAAKGKMPAFAQKDF